jgi:hypothetical protein
MAKHYDMEREEAIPPPDRDDQQPDCQRTNWPRSILSV